MEDPAGLDVTFVGAPGNLLRTLTRSGNKLVASGQLREVILKTTGVADVAVDEFDAFVLVGLKFTINRCVRLFATHRPWRAEEPETIGGDEWFLASRPFLLEAAEERLRQSAAMSLVRELRTVTAAPILVVPQPHLSERVLEFGSESTEVWRDLHARGRASEVRSIHEEACQALGKDFEIVPQPEETITDEIFTLGQYDCAEPSRRPISHFHVSHMNLEYGRFAMRDLLDRLAS